MRKLLVMVMTLLFGGSLLSQPVEDRVFKSFFTINGGYSTPVSDFSSSSSYNPDAGFAKRGTNLNLSYGFVGRDNVGWATSFIYDINGANIHMVPSSIHTTQTQIPIKMDHWQIFALATGPMITLNPIKSLYIDIKLMAGAANARAPKLSYQEKVLANENWTVAPFFQSGADCRFGVGNNLFVIAAADYMFMKPYFSHYVNPVVSDQIVTGDFRQKISIVNLSAGIGLMF